MNFEDAYHDCKLVFDGIVDAKSFQEADSGLVLSYRKEIFEALEKQIAKEPLNIYDVPFDVHLFGDCPSCGCRVNTMMHHCDGCGQKLDWKVWKNYWVN